MPTEDGIRREETADLLQDLPAQDFSLHRQPPPLIVVEDDPFLTDLLLEHVDLRPLEVDDLLLLLVDPAGENHEEKLPGVENEAHGAPMRKVRGDNLSIGWPPDGVKRPKRASAGRS